MMNEEQTLQEQAKLALKRVRTMQRFIALGYVLNFRDGDRYIELSKMFNNDDDTVTGGDQLQIGRFIELYRGQVISKTYMKRGWLWSGSAYATAHKNNIYAIGTERLIATL